MTEAVRDVLGTVLRRYMQAGYGSVEPAFFEPFDGDSRFAANGGRVKVVNLTDKYRRLWRGDIQQIQINAQPIDGFPSITDLQDTVKAHAQLGITYEYLDWIEPWMRPTYHRLLEAKREKFECFEELETLESPSPDFTQDGRSGEAERERLEELAQRHVNEGVRYTGLSEWEAPRYMLELEAAADDRDLEVSALTPVDGLPDTADPDSQSAKVEEVRLTFGPFTKAELAILSEHLGDIDEYSPDMRTEVLVDHFRRLNMAGVRFEAGAHGD